MPVQREVHSFKTAICEGGFRYKYYQKLRISPKWQKTCSIIESRRGANSS